MYVQDCDETFPCVTGQGYPPQPGIPTEDQTWVYNDILVLMQAYVKNYNVYSCPDRQKNVPASGDFCTPGPMTQFVWGYGYNWSSGYGDSGNPKSLWNLGDGCVLTQMKDGTLPGRSISGVNFPTQFIALGDTGDTPRQTLHTATFDTRCTGNFNGGNADLPSGARHQGGNNFAFSDGHAKYYKFNGSFVAPYNVGVTTPAVVPNRYWLSATWDGQMHSP